MNHTHIQQDIINVYDKFCFFVQKTPRVPEREVPHKRKREELLYLLILDGGFSHGGFQ